MEVFQRVLAQARAYWANLSPVRRVLVAAATLVAVVGVAAFAYLGSSGDLVPLYSEAKTPEETHEIITKLKASGKSHELDRVHGVMVPSNLVAEYQVLLAGEGIPVGAGKGLAAFEDTSSLTSTPFIDKVRYQRAIQAELSRQIALYPGVKSARVIVSQPDTTAFLRQRDPPTASVMVVMKPNESLNQESAAAITRLVSFAIAGMKPEHVTIVDSNGRHWAEEQADQRNGPSAAQLKYKREYENGLKEKAERILASSLGKNRVIVSVTADLDFRQEKSRSSRVVPEEKGIEREYLREFKSTNATAGGITGVTSNVRPASAVGSRAGGTASETLTQTDTKYSQLLRETDDHNTPINRLSIAAIVDLTPQPSGEGQPPTTPLTTAEVEALIKSATGFVDTRDQIKVTNALIPGPLLPTPEADDETARIQRLAAYVSLARNISLAVAIVMAVSLIPLLLLRRRTKPSAVDGPAAPASPGKLAEVRRQELIQKLVDLARTDPDRTASVFGLLAGTPTG